MTFQLQPIKRLVRSDQRVSAPIPSHRHITQQASPAQETENVRLMLKLAATIRQRDPSPAQPRMPTRLMTRSWAEEAQARAEAAASGSASERSDTEMLSDIDDATEERLLRPKRMHESLVELSLPFASQPEILERYIATSGLIRLGKIFEDLDNLAGDISYTHVLQGRPKAGEQSRIPIFIVTASVDRLDLLQPLRADRDYRLRGGVIYVGSSAMEVLVTVVELGDSGSETICLTGRFTMATRNAKTGRSQRIAPLLLETEEEQKLFQMGEDHKKRKRAFSETSLDRVPPTREEVALLHTQWLQASKVQNDTDLQHVRNTALTSTQHMHPQQRNGE
ncbi:Acyl-CoA thioesterase [Ceraceosorus bombacis]|uniref:Acyl-CoA thioesterase n=1 Tax=Ceraceosorus bombacis TaxID=401625 RepID=A0A0P1BAL3_9BASI|nr:Acyl-CoA thioesterase [Ceraceosorus bombacis]